ncbi:MAG: hypothetical protein KDD89_11265, partial [Anaerolineales bacterium]|nr:hypothetical protein [Anaerolineales bacterium]
MKRATHLERQITRLEKRLVSLHEYNRRFISARLFEFVLGLTAGVIALFAISLQASLLVFAITFIAFTVLVLLHQRTRRTIDQFEGWVAIRRTHLARMALDWAHIPPRPLTRNNAGDTPRTPLELDFDIV